MSRRMYYSNSFIEFCDLIFFLVSRRAERFGLIHMQDYCTFVESLKYLLVIKYCLAFFYRHFQPLAFAPGQTRVSNILHLQFQNSCVCVFCFFLKRNCVKIQTKSFLPVVSRTLIFTMYNCNYEICLTEERNEFMGNDFQVNLHKLKIVPPYAVSENQKIYPIRTN